VYAIAGPSGAGAASAVAQAGKAGEVAVYSYDSTPDVVAALKAGQITALLAQPAADIGAQAVRSVVEYLKDAESDGPVPKATEADLQLPLMVLTADNVDSPEAAGYLTRSTCDEE
jgi:ribose transport system substrate-binding protein